MSTTPTYYIGEVEDICAEITERDSATFTISAVTVTITTAAEVALTGRTNVAASYSGAEVWFHETFSTANGYAEGGSYIATFKATITRDTGTYAAKAIVRFRVLSTPDV